MSTMEEFIAKLRTANWKNQFLFNIGFPARIASLFGDVEILKGTGRAVPTPVGTKGELAATTAPTDQQVFMVDDWDGHGANRQFVYDAHSTVIADGTFIVEPTAPGVAGNYIALAWGVHTHAIIDVSGLQAALAAKAPKVAGTDGHVVVIDGTGSAQSFKDGGPMPSGGSGGGATWRFGSGVPSDSLGVNGDCYVRTSNDDVYQKADGSYTVVGNLKGSNGTNGLSILTTSGAPATETGTDGQYAYDPTAMTMYGPKATTWPEGVLLKGADGAGGTSLFKGAVRGIVSVLPTEGLATGYRYLLDESAGEHANQLCTYDAADGGSWAYEVPATAWTVYCAVDDREVGHLADSLAYFNGTKWQGALNVDNAAEVVRVLDKLSACVYPNVERMVDPTSGLPTTCAIGRRIIAGATANGWTATRIYEAVALNDWTDAIETIPTAGATTYLDGQGDGGIENGDLDMLVSRAIRFDGVEWAPQVMEAPLAFGVAAEVGNATGATIPKGSVVCFSGITTGGTRAADTTDWLIEENAYYDIPNFDGTWYCKIIADPDDKFHVAMYLSDEDRTAETNLWAQSGSDVALGTIPLLPSPSFTPAIGKVTLGAAPVAGNFEVIYPSGGGLRLAPTGWTGPVAIVGDDMGNGNGGPVCFMGVMFPQPQTNGLPQTDMLKVLVQDSTDVRIGDVLTLSATVAGQCEANGVGQPVGYALSCVLGAAGTGAGVLCGCARTFVSAPITP